MFDVRQTPTFARWYDGVRDREARRRIATRILKVRSGLLGHIRTFGSVSELKIDYGPGYRLYFTMRGQTVVWLLCGGDKRDQDRDIAEAKRLAAELE